MAQTDLTDEQITTFAAGLYQLAVVDGVDESEVQVIKDFLQEVGQEDKIGAVDRLEFDPAMLPWVFETSFLRRVFLKTCWALVKADNKVSDKERDLIQQYAAELGLEAELKSLEADAGGL